MEAPDVGHRVQLRLLELELLLLVKGLAVKSPEQKTDLLLRSCINVSIWELLVEHGEGPAGEAGWDVLGDDGGASACHLFRCVSWSATWCVCVGRLVASALLCVCFLVCLPVHERSAGAKTAACFFASV